ENDTISSRPVFSKDTLANPENVPRQQLTSAVHVHPNGRFVYASERATVEVQGKSAYVGGDNTIIVYEIDQRTGEPNLIQRVYTKGMHPRAFSIDPSGRLLIAANKSPVRVTDKTGEHILPASLDVFR